MNIDQGKTHWSATEMDDLRQAVRDIMAAEDRTQSNIARESQIPASTLSQFLSATYAGDVQKVARDVARFIDARNREREVVSRAPPEPTFVRTATAEKVLSALTHAQVLSDMAVIVGPPGVGKSSAAEQYAKTTPRVVRITASPAISGITAVLVAIMRVTRADTKSMFGGRSTMDRSEVVRGQLGQGSLLIVDEAQHVSQDALEELRAIHDASRCGLALMGNRSVLTRLEGGQRDAAYAQLFSRAGWRVQLEKGGDHDVLPVLETMGVNSPDVLDVAREIARKDSLRVVVKAVRSAILLSGATRENLEPKHLRAAYRQLGGQ